jgi:hypothetical protein
MGSGLDDGRGGIGRRIDSCIGSGRAKSVRLWVKIKIPTFSVLVIATGRWLGTTSPVDCSGTNTRSKSPKAMQ